MWWKINFSQQLEQSGTDFEKNAIYGDCKLKMQKYKKMYSFQAKKKSLFTQYLYNKFLNFFKEKKS